MPWGVDPVLWLQSYPWLALPMVALSALGSPAFYLGLVAVLSWWRERAFALAFSMLFAISAIVNDLVKLVVHAPRPYWVSADVVPLDLQESFGFPSAHAQLAVSLWGLIALRLRRPRATAAAAALVLAIGVSRIALGAHFPIDVLGGWAIGAAVLAAYVLAGPAVSRAVGRLSPRGRILAALALSLGAVGVSTAVAAAIGPWAPDPSWTGLVTGLAPATIEYTLIAAGFALGLVVGHELDRGCRSFRSPGAGIVGTLLGLAVIALLWYGVGAALPPGSPVADPVVYLVSAAIGAWCMAGAPALFCRLGLYGGAGPEHSSLLGDHA